MGILRTYQWGRTQKLLMFTEREKGTKYCSGREDAIAGVFSKIWDLRNRRCTLFAMSADPAINIKTQRHHLHHHH